MSAGGSHPLRAPSLVSISPNMRSTSSPNVCSSAKSGSVRGTMTDLLSGNVFTRFLVSTQDEVSSLRGNAQRGGAQLRQRPCLDLADALGRHAESPADLPEGLRLAVQPVAPTD